MTRDRGGQRTPLSPLAASNRGGAGPAAAADVVGSSTKDHAWQRRTGAGGGASRLAPPSDRKKAKKVEGTVMAGGAATTASRIPTRPGAPQPSGPHQPQQPGSSRIPRPPVFDLHEPSPQPTNLAAMLASPPAPPGRLDELGSAGDSTSPHEHGWVATAGKAPTPQGFHTYANPSFDGAQFLAATPASDARSNGSSSAGAVGSAPGGPGLGAAARVFTNGLAEAEAGAATPGFLDPAALTPNTERSLQAWLRGSPAVAGRQQSDARARSAAPGAASSSAAYAPLPTPEAWQLLQHVNSDSPQEAAPQGVRGLMNAYLRTGPQLLSPEPEDSGVIRAPDAAAVPAQGLLAVAGPGGAGVMGMMNAYLRTSAHQLSPEPGLAAPAPSPLPALAAPMHPYSPVSPLVATPVAPALGAAAAAGAGGRGPISPSSVCSNGAVASSGPLRSVPRLDLSALRRQQQGGTTDCTEVSLDGVVPPAQQQQQQQHQRQQQPDSPGGGELPTVRFSPAPSPAVGEDQEAGVAREAARQHRPPSPITFCLPGDSPGQEQAQAPAASNFSFGFGAAPAGAPAEAAAAAAVEAQAGVEAAAAAAAEPAAGPDAAAAAFLPRIGSGETVQGPNPFNAVLAHLRGPQYASPARFLLPGGQGPDQGSPQSPKQCTPLHLISASDASPGAAASPPAAGPTPAPGQGSLTVWMDRRGMRAALSTPARNDLRLLWAAAHDVTLYRSEAAALRCGNAALAEELEAAQAALAELGLDRSAAEVAAEAGALCAEAEAAKARDAAGHMMALAGQIQAMFQLCEASGGNEKEELVGELAAARAKLAGSEAAAADTASAGGQQQAQLQAQLDEARQAVAAAQAAADAAQQRATGAAAELASIRSQLAEVQQQVAPPAGTPAGQTPTARLRRRLGGLHDSLEQLHSELCAGRVQAAPTPELDGLLEASRRELAQVEALLGGGAAALREENSRLAARLQLARGLLAEHSPGGAAASPYADGGSALRRSPLPFSLFGRLGERPCGGSSEGEASPATTATACPSPDVFTSPFLASQATLTVDYRDLAPPSTGAASVRQASPSAASPPSGEDSAALLDGAAQQLAADQGQATPAAGEEEQEEVTVEHNGMVITHVPASEARKVKSMVQWWEAVATGTPMAVSAEEAAAAEAYANAAVAAAEANLAAQATAAQEAAALPAGAGEEGQPAEAGVAAPVEVEVAAGSPGAQPTPIRMLPEATPIRFASGLPFGDAATPGALPAAVGGTPARLTPLGFATAPPPTPADGIDLQQAQQLHQLALSAAAAAVAGSSPAASTPASALRTASRLPATPAGTPAGASPLGLAVTPLALSALRARLAGSAGGVQDAVRSRLARLKADLAAAQAKLATVDMGLASIALTPTSSITNSATPGSRSSSLQRRTPLTPSTGGGAGLLASPASSGARATSPAFETSPGLDSSRAAALIAAGGASPLAAPAGASPAAVSQPAFAWQQAAATEALTPGQAQPAAGWAEVQDSAPAPTAAGRTAAAECTPPVTRRSVRFADTVQQACSSGRGALRHGTPYSAAMPVEGAEQDQQLQQEAAASAASPVVASCRRSPLGRPPAASPAAAGWARSPLAPMQSAAKPAGGEAGVRLFAADASEAGSGSGSSSDEEDERYDISRMGQRTNRAAASPSPALLLARAASDGATPMAHPGPRFGGQEEEEEGEEEEGYGSYSGRRAPSTTPGASVLSTSSFSPPQPLVLLAGWRQGRARRSGLMRAGGAGGARAPPPRRSEADEREFRRRAAALNIAISPYFRRG